VIVRSDLPTGIREAQCVHAAGESVQGPVPEGTNAVVLSADAATLAALELRLQAAGVPHAAIREPDPPYHGALLAIGIAPAARAVIRQYVSSLPLLRERRVA
jgi:peptidyl-tRNA hydrolase